MTDNVVLNPGFGGDVVAADDINGVLHQRVKVEFGDSDAATQVSSGNPLPTKDILSGSIPTATFGHLKYHGSASIDIAASSAAAESGSPAYFSFGPDNSGVSVIRVSQITIEMEVAAGFTSSYYGDMTSSLISGSELQIMAGSGSSWTTVQNLTPDAPIKSNIDWARYCDDIKFFTTLDGNQFMIGKWSFITAGVPLRLDAAASESLVLVVRDDLSSLTSHKIAVQGIIETQLT